GLPIVADAVVDLVCAPVQNIKRRLVHMAVLLRLAARAVFFQMNMERLGDAVFRLDVVFAPGLRAVGEVDLPPLAHARQRTQPLQLGFEVIDAGDRADKHAVGLAVIMRFVLRRDWIGYDVLHRAHDLLLGLTPRTVPGDSAAASSCGRSHAPRPPAATRCRNHRPSRSRLPYRPAPMPWFDYPSSPARRLPRC